MFVFVFFFPHKLQNINKKPKGLKVAKEDQKADRHDGQMAERGRWSIGMMVDRHNGQ